MTNESDSKAQEYAQLVNGEMVPCSYIATEMCNSCEHADICVTRGDDVDDEGITPEALKRLEAILWDVREYFHDEFDVATLAWVDEGLDIVATLA